MAVLHPVALCTRTFLGHRAGSAAERRAVGDCDLFDVQVVDAFPEELAVNRISIADQEPRRFIKRRCLDNSLGRAIGRQTALLLGEDGDSMDSAPA